MNSDRSKVKRFLKYTDSRDKFFECFFIKYDADSWSIRERTFSNANKRGIKDKLSLRVMIDIRSKLRGIKPSFLCHLIKAQKSLNTV